MFDNHAPFDFWAIVGWLALAVGIGLVWNSATGDGEVKCDEYDWKYGANGQMYCEP